MALWFRGARRAGRFPKPVARTLSRRRRRAERELYGETSVHSWGSGLPGQPFRYTGTDVVEERDGRVAVFYTFIDSGTPPVSSMK
jgi:hypothetical protein